MPFLIHMNLTLGEIASRLGTSAPNSVRDLVITGINTLEDAGEEELSFLGLAKYRHQLPTTQAAAVFVSEEFADASVAVVQLVVKDAAAAADAVLGMLAPPVPRPPVGVDASAHVATSATLGRDVAIGPNAFVGERVVLGHNAVLHAGVVVGDDATVGDGTELFPHVVIRERCTIGHRVAIHANAVIGTDGFGYRFDGQRHAKIPHVGTVVIEDEVEIGSGTTIDRGKFAETRIGGGTKIDNLVQIGHNVRLGRLCIVCANVGIAGSTIVGDGVILAGGAGLKDHITIGKGARIAAYTGVGNDVPPGATLMGALYGMPQKQFLREQAALRRLPELMKQVRELQKQVAELQASRP